MTTMMSLNTNTTCACTVPAAGFGKPAFSSVTRKALRPRNQTFRCQAQQGGQHIHRRALLATAGASAIVQAANAASSDDYKTAPNGLKWLDTQEGTGPSPVKGATIKCHYTGKLTNGTVFDSSYPRRQPLSFKIGVRQVIAGWDEGILGDGKDVPPMKEGGKRSLIIPAELGYGKRGAGGVIPPDATLMFDVELLGRK